jgi:predicted phosphate transport protein (TIGR00153 family)
MEDKIQGLLIAHSQKVLTAIHALKSACEAWQRGDRDEVTRFVDELSKLEMEADSLRRSVASELTRSGIAYAKTELFRRLVHTTDDVADTARRAGRFLLIVNDLLVPPEMKGDIVKMAAMSQTAMSNLAEAIHCLREPPECRIEYIATITDLEESIDDIEFKLQHDASALQLDTWSTIIFWRLILTVSRIADNIEDAADELLAYEGEI